MHYSKNWAIYVLEGFRNIYFSIVWFWWSQTFSFILHYNLTFSVPGIRVGYRWGPSFKWIVKDQFRKHQTPSGIGFRSSSCHGHNSLYYSYRNWNSTHIGGVWTWYRWSIFKKKFILLQVSINLWQGNYFVNDTHLILF